jgi:hypothetical protein
MEVIKHILILMEPPLLRLEMYVVVRGVCLTEPGAVLVDIPDIVLLVDLLEVVEVLVDIPETAVMAAEGIFVVAALYVLLPLVVLEEQEGAEPVDKGAEELVFLDKEHRVLQVGMVAREEQIAAVGLEEHTEEEVVALLAYELFGPEQPVNFLQLMWGRHEFIYSN